MKTLGIFEIKTRLSRICEEVAQTGESVLVTRRGRPLVRIDPLSHETAGHSPVWEARQRHEAEYGIHQDVPDVRSLTEGIYDPFEGEDV
ncbi:MAG: type II toxin-antitoxin system prevent-host-death family antitoxin [Spirochaetes bacterium]|nr:type II toxin-antitoxin system prevent-host-death family antitoxin [Spirochaetota bacterium]